MALAGTDDGSLVPGRQPSFVLEVNVEVRKEGSGSRKLGRPRGGLREALLLKIYCGAPRGLVGEVGDGASHLHEGGTTHLLPVGTSKWTEGKMRGRIEEIATLTLTIFSVLKM